jgi:predicted phage baseplate assembly protein
MNGRDHDGAACGCCEGLAIATPRVVDNPPARSAIADRVGRHAEFKRSMLAGLSLSRSAALSALTVRDDDDFAIALIDAWATVADVLTFYGERISNEAFLRTATERRSLVELARAIGYELRPGLAVDVDLAFTIDGSPGAAEETTVPAGTRAQSVPGPGETAQTFETIEEIPARAAWNAMTPRLGSRITLAKGMDHLYLAGVATGLRQGDHLLLVTEETHEPLLKQVTGVIAEAAPFPQPGRTRVALDPADSEAGTPLTMITAEPPPGRSVAAVKYLKLAVAGKPAAIGASDLKIAAIYDKFLISDLFVNIAATPPPPPSVRAFRVRAALFGHNAPRWDSLPRNIRPEGREDSWADAHLANYLAAMAGQVGAPPDNKTIFLDSSYPAIVAGSYIVLEDGKSGDWDLFEVKATAYVSAADFAITGRVTQLTLNKQLGAFGIRTTAVYAQSEELPLTLEPDDSPVTGMTIDLAEWVDGLADGQRLIVCGELAENRGNRGCEVATIAAVTAIVEEDGGFARLTMAAPLAAAYLRDSVTISGNVARATHGEAKREILGSGDAARAYQTFPLRQPPLTHVRAANASGSASTLQVYVDAVRWQETPSFFGHGPADRVFITRTDDAGRTVVQFGDGRSGARLPTGVENIVAGYRSGSGLGALVKAGQISLLMTRPAGVTGVVNPLPANGGEDPEALDDARQTAPLSVIALDRVVALRDYEDFARAFTGIAKALATWIWDGQERGVFLTIAGPRGAEIPAGSETAGDLRDAIRNAGDPRVPLTVASYTPRFFLIEAAIRIDLAFQKDVVTTAIDDALHARYSFDARAFGQPVTQGEVIAAIQSLPGVVSVDLQILDISDPDRVEPPVLQPHLTAALPAAGAGGLPLPAELLLLDPRPVGLEIIV